MKRTKFVFEQVKISNSSDFHRKSIPAVNYSNAKVKFIMFSRHSYRYILLFLCFK